MPAQQQGGRVRWMLWTGIAVLGLVVTVSLGAPLVTSFAPDAQDMPEQKRYLSPSLLHPFGCDQFGRDVFARVLYGGRVSLLIAGIVIGLSISVGLTIGVVAGFVGGLVDRVLMRLLDVFLAFPVMFLSVACLAILGSGMLPLIIVLALTGWMDIARLVRSEILSLRQQPFTFRARAFGLSPARVAIHHLIPNVIPTLLAATTLRVADIILLESALSFLGLGPEPPSASWGGIIGDGRMVLSSAWWMTLFPGIAIVLTSGSLHLIGDSLRSRP